MKEKVNIIMCIILSLIMFISFPCEIMAAEKTIAVKAPLTGDSSDAPSTTTNNSDILEGMAVGEKYIYIAKRNNAKNSISIYRKNKNTNKTELLKFVTTKNGTTNRSGYSTELGIALDMCVITVGNKTTLMVAKGGSENESGIVQISVDNPKKELTIEKQIKFVHPSKKDSNGKALPIAVKSIAYAGKNGDNWVFYLRTKLNSSSSGFAIYKTEMKLTTKKASYTGTKICTLNRPNNYSGQGMAFYNNNLYLGLSKKDNDTKIGVYSTTKTGEIDATKYITLKTKNEIEGVDIKDGHLYYSLKIEDTDNDKSNKTYHVYESETTL